MNVRNIVKVMNFHALLRVTDARDRVNDAFRYERELKYIISSIVNNRIFKQEHVSLDIDDEGVELNIYLGSDLGFCANFNSDVMYFLKTDDAENDKIIIENLYKSLNNDMHVIVDEILGENIGYSDDIDEDSIINNKRNYWMYIS